MSRVASNYPPAHFNNGAGQLSRSSSNSSTVNPLANGAGGRGFTVRSAAPPPTQKETVHACPLCNGPYKDPRVLPCTHTYCLNCIREKLLANNRLTCPKCHHQVEPFDENDLNGLQRNLILSQEWRLNTKPLPTLPTSKKPVAYQPPVSNPSTQMPKQQDKRKSSVADSNGHESSSTHSHGGIAALVNAFDRRSSRSSSVASTQPTVSNLVRIYSEATNSKAPDKFRSDSVVSTSKHEELVRIFEQATSRSQRQETPTKSSIKRPSQAYEEITWDSLTHGTTPAAPPFPAQWQTATENIHRPSQLPERPISAASSASSDQQSNVSNLREIISSVQQHSATYQRPTIDSRTHSRRSSSSSSPSISEHSPGQRTPVQQGLIYATIQPPPQQQQHSRQNSYADSMRSVSSASTAKRSPPPSISNTYQQISNTSSPQRVQQQQKQQEERASRTASVASSSRRSSERFPPPPPPQVETLDFGRPGSSKPRSTSSMSSRSSAYIDATETNFLSTERFNPDTDIPVPVHTNNSSRGNSQLGSRSSTPSNRSPSKSVEREAPYLAPIPAASLTNNVNSRVEVLLSDQKRLEREIEEQVRRLKHDYDDIRKQVERKETSIHHEVKNITARLDEDITTHYQQKQKIYADLAADTNSVGHQLERLKSSSNLTNKQQLWANLEQIESNLQNIRRAVEQQKDSQGAFSFAEGHRRLAADTIGQITYPQRFHSPPAPLPAAQTEPQLSPNITPYKYLKIDHLATLEPEAMAITANNKKILLGICNKLFVLDEHGSTINVIPLLPSIRGIAVSKKAHAQNIAYVSHDETVSIINIETGQTIDSVKETDSSGQSGVFLPLGIDTDHIRGDVYVCDYRNSCVLKFDDKLEFLTQWRIYNHYDQYDEARPKLISVQGHKFYMIVEHSCKPYNNQGIAYTFSLHICDVNSGNIIKIIDADFLGPQRLRWPCSIQALANDKCYVLDTMTAGKYFNGQWQKHWSRVLELSQDEQHPLTELFQLDSEAATMGMTKENMIIAANGDILFVNLAFLKQQQQQPRRPTFSTASHDHEYQNLP